MAKQSTFGIGIGEIFSKGFTGWKSNIIPLTLAGIVPIAVASGFSSFAQQFNDVETIVEGILWFAINFAGWVIAGTLSYPWYMYALRAVDGDPVVLSEPFETPKRFLYQFVGSFWFFAGFLFGIRFIVIPFLPAILILVLYAFYGFLIADEGRTGFNALGTSIRMGEKRRIGLFAIALMFLMFNFLGLVPGLGLEGASFTLRLILASLGLVFTTSITLVSGAAIYRTFRGFLHE